MVKLIPCWFALVSLTGLLVTAVGDKASKNRTTVLVLTEDETRYEYVGTKKCRSCHSRSHESWRASPKGRSWDALKPGLGVELKQLAGLEREKDYRTDVRCLKCHSVGFGHQTGYAIPQPSDGASVRFARKREGAGCESCHGPGSGFVKVMRDIFRNERPYRQEELRAAGLREIARENCLRCHTLEATCIVPDGKDSTYPAGALDVDLQDRAGFHGAFSLRYRMSGTTRTKPWKADER